jgi:hypothetical protein
MSITSVTEFTVNELGNNLYDFPTPLTLDGAINDAQTTLSVNEAVPGDWAVPFPVSIDAETLWVTAMSGADNKDWTTTRGIGGSTATEHDDGATVKMVVGSTIINQHRRALIELKSRLEMVSMNFVIGNGETVVQTGVAIYAARLDFDGEIQSVALYADQSGSIQLDIWKVAHSGYPSDNADSICGGNEIALSSEQSTLDDTLTDWTKTVSAGDVLTINVDSASTVTMVTLCLKIKRI